MNKKCGNSISGQAFMENYIRRINILNEACPKINLLLFYAETNCDIYLSLHIHTNYILSSPHPLLPIPCYVHAFYIFSCILLVTNTTNGSLFVTCDCFTCHLPYQDMTCHPPVSTDDPHHVGKASVVNANEDQTVGQQTVEEEC